ncbi:MULTISPECIES: FxsA family membrane protein [unclassified Streptomyces]|uniref:FxsA family membrane protein n=1 Tax=unclassified Streptomyces TaxID=2593676 RepID=UPI0006B22798|nr:MULTISPECIES: FxsA family membrane protein [unclassified Streptomyces]KOY54613.1 membrane protein [Streptomyces sp. XY332]THA39580.1 FxsA family protein [Streptomyces sp. A1547]
MTTGVPLSTAPRRRSRARTFLPLAVAAWLVLEIWLLSLVAGAAGGLTVAALLAGGIVLGVVVIKRAGRRAFKNLTTTFQQAQQGQQPTPQQPGSGNGLTMLAGLLLILPGLVSDVVGLLCLLPPVRAWIGRRVAGSLERKMATAPAGSFGDAFQQARIHYPDGKVVQGEVIREDEPRQPGPDAGYRPPLAP